MRLFLAATLVVSGCTTRSSGEHAKLSHLDFLKTKANDLFRLASHDEAAAIYARGLEEATRSKNFLHAGRFRLGLGNCAFARLEHREAAGHYLKARELARKANDLESLSVLAENLSSLYLRMGDLKAALAAISETLNDSAGANTRPSLLLNAGILRARNGEPERARELLAQGTAAAYAEGDLLTAAKGWNQLGSEYLRSGRLEAAEAPLIEAFRLFKMTRTREMAAAYRNLGSFRSAQGRHVEALALLDAAIQESLRSRAGLPLWDLHYHRGVARLESGDLFGGIADLDAAIGLARRWRVGVVPSDSVRIGADVTVQKLYDEYIAAAMQAFKQTKDAVWVRRAFAAAEENRAYAFRERLIDSRRLTPAYWTAVASLRKSETLLMAENSPKNQALAAAARLRLTEAEIQLGLLEQSSLQGISHRNSERSRSDNTLRFLRKALGPNEALLSFHIGQKESYLWALTDSNFEVHQIPDALRTEATVKHFRQSIESNRSDLYAEAESVYSMFLGGLSAGVGAREQWLLVPDGALFDLPFAALRTGNSFLFERASLRIIPSGIIDGHPGDRLPSGRFVGFGDPIYNAADARWNPGMHRPLAGMLATAGTLQPDMELARLPAASRELDACSRAWTGAPRPLLLTGTNAGRAALNFALRDATAILHFATHVVPRPDIPDQNWIALGLAPNGEADFLTPTEIASRRLAVGLVAMSGCGSGAGKALPGAGLLGLARAWLLSGAGAVAATYWPVRDESGALFQSFYMSLSRSGRRPAPAAAEALRQAQAEMLGSKDWRSEPRYWSALFIAGKD